MMAATRVAWAHAFARQARSDWTLYRELVARDDVPVCHALHFLQMACEKIGKAYRCLDTQADLDELLRRHVGFARFVRTLILSPAYRVAYRGREASLRNLLKTSERIAREIEKLAPAVDRLDAPENAEYPWARGDQVYVPAEYGFPSLRLLHEPGGRQFLKLIGNAIEAFF